MDEILLEVYKQCNEHIRASDNKRDQMIAFYLLIISLLFGSLDKLNRLTEFVALTKFVAITIGILGFVIAFIIITLRKWHTVYVKTAIVVQYLTLNKIKPTEEAIKDAWTNLTQEGSYTIKVSPRTGKKWKPLSTENITYTLFLIIAFTPFYLIKYELWMIGLHIAYVFLMNKISDWVLKRELQDEYLGSWLLRLYLPKADN